MKHFLLGFALLSIGLADRGWAGDLGRFEPYLNQAQALKLSTDRNWQVLLHYQTSFLGGWESEVDDPTFFFDRQGKTGPAAELQASLIAFLSPYQGPPTLESQPSGAPWCRFPARWHWLQQSLKIPDSVVPVHSCPLLSKWLGMLDLTSVTLVFPSYDIFVPGSMFGHTLLRLDSRQNTATPILNYSINFAAVADPEAEGQLFYGLKGVFGGYVGKFSLLPYYQKVTEYSDMELRDIWEYQLDFNPEELHRLALHAWEMQSTYFDYFFFKENCSYQLLSLLQVARPSLRLQEKFGLWAAPTDTIRVLLAALGKQPKVHFRPSRYRRYLSRMQTAQEPTKRAFRSLTQNMQWVDSPEYQRLLPQVKAEALDLWYDLSWLKHKKTAPSTLERIKTARAKVRYTTRPPKVKRPTVLPGQGHLSSKSGMARGRNTQQHAFTEAWTRLSFHDLTDPTPGYAANSGIEFFKVRLRSTKANKLTVEEFSLFNVETLWPSKYGISPWAWGAQVGMKRDRINCHCLPFSVEGRIGKSIELGSLLLAAFGEGSLAASRFYATGSSLQIGVGGLALINLQQNLKLRFDSRWMDRLQTQKKRNYLRGTLAWHLSDQSELRLMARQVGSFQEQKLEANLYW